MQKRLIRTAVFLTLMLTAALARSADGANAAAPASMSAAPMSATLTPEQARQILSTLQDPQKRAVLVNTLRALTLVPSTVPAPASGASGPLGTSSANSANANNANNGNISSGSIADSSDHNATAAIQINPVVLVVPVSAAAPVPLSPGAATTTAGHNPHAAGTTNPTPSGAATPTPTVAGTSPGSALLAALSKSNAPSASAATAASSPLVSNGLIAQLVRQTSHWGRSALVEARGASGVLRGFPAVAQWLHDTVHDADARTRLLHAVWSLALVMGAALVGEWLLSRLLRYPRRLLAAGGLRDERSANADLTEITAQAQAQAEADAQQDAALEAARETTLAQAGMVEAPDSSESAQPHTGQTDAARTRTPQAPVAHTPPDAAVAPGQTPLALPSSAAAQVQAVVSATAHWRLLKRLPAMLAHFVLTVLPLIAFFMIASAVSSLLTDDGSVTQSVIENITNAYLVVRTILVIVRLIIAPDAPGLRMVLLSDHTAGRLQNWTMWIAGSIVVGSGLADAMGDLGLSDAGHDAILRLAVLLGHLLAVVVVLRYRRAINRTIRRYTDAKPSLAMLGAWVADIWAFVAIFVIVASWFAWALNVKNGLSRVFDLLGQSIGILALARIVAIVLLGALARLFNRGEEPADQSPVVRRAHRYYPLLRKFVSALTGLVTLVVLLQVWGIDSLHWLAFAPIGKSLMSAGVTVGVAAVIALLIWECANAFVERRLERWSEGEDRLRAARLRTLLPMLRTVLLILIALIVGLTALNQLGVNTAPLLASASIIGVALGFGSQKLVQDFITGIFLLMENAMQVGDNVTVAGVSGTVEYLSIRTVRLRASDGSLYTVPFSSVSTVNNTNRGIGNAAVKVSVAYDADLDLVIATLQQIGAALRTDPAYADMILNDFEYWGVDVVEGAMVTVSGQMRARDSGRWSVQREFNRRVLLRFRELGIPLADTQRKHLSLDQSALQALAERPAAAAPAPDATGPAASAPPAASKKAGDADAGSLEPAAPQ